MAWSPKMVDEPETGRLEPYGKRLSSPGCYRASLSLLTDNVEEFSRVPGLRVIPFGMD